MTSDTSLRKALLMTWTAAIFAFVFAPILITVVFSFNADRYPSLPWGGFSLHWYEQALADTTISRGLVNSLIVSVSTALIATFIGFAAAYVDYRYNFFGKSAYTAMMVLPPTVPVVILGLAMLTFVSQLGLNGTLRGIIVGHVVYAAPFGLALIRLRLAELDPNLEPAAWNLGATQWGAMHHVIIPFCMPAILATLFLTAAVSFDEFMIAWFVSGLNETLPVRVLAMLQGRVSPVINAVGSMVFAVSIALIITAQIFTLRRTRLSRSST